jgi:hypothetical protein
LLAEVADADPCGDNRPSRRRIITWLTRRAPMTERAIRNSIRGRL